MHSIAESNAFDATTTETKIIMFNDQMHLQIGNARNRIQQIVGLHKMLFPAKWAMTSALLIDISDPNFVLQALKLLHHSPEFLPFVVFLSSPGSSALRNQLASGANHLSNGQNGAPGILSSVCPLFRFKHPSLLCLSSTSIHASSETLFSTPVPVL